MRALPALMVLMAAARMSPYTLLSCPAGYVLTSADLPQQEAPGYRLKPGEFPPEHSERVISGELVEADYIHRSGVFRSASNGQLVSFTLLPYGSVFYLNTEADLRDVPLGASFDFFLYPDDRGTLSQVAVMRDKHAESTDVEAQKRVAEQQRKRHVAFLKERGLPAWIDRVEGDKLTVTLFSGDTTFLQTLFKQEGIDPAQWAKEHRRISVAVANEHLRTYLPNVTNKGAIVEEFQSVPKDRYGCSGVRLVIRPELMLEGYRKGHIVRLFAPSWPVEAMPFGEGLYAGGHDEEPADSKELLPTDFPYRTDFGNEDLPWYTLQPGKFPPDHSEHRVGGELVKVNTDGRSGQLRMDLTKELVEFTLPPVGKVRYLNADAALEDLPLGMRCLFFLYQDGKGAFTQAAIVEDEFTYLAESTLTYRVEAVDVKAGKLMVVRHAAPVKVDYVLEPRVPIDFGRIELEVDATTRIWKRDHQVKLSGLAVGDELLVNLAASTPTSRRRCTDIWAGADTHRLATEQQRKRHTAAVK